MKRAWQRFRQNFEFSPREANGFLLLVLIIVGVILVPQLYTPKPAGSEISERDQQLLDSLVAVHEKGNQVASHPLVQSPNTSSQPLEERSKPERKVSLNQATPSEWERIPGIGPVLSKRIVKYRDILGGFVHPDQLAEVYGLKPEVAQQVCNHLDCNDLVPTKHLKVNTASPRELLSHPYINKSQMRRMVDFRYQNGTISAKDLTEIDSTLDVKGLLPYLRFK